MQAVDGEMILSLKFVVLGLLCLSSVAGGTVLTFWMQAQLARAGIPAKPYFGTFDFIWLPRKYLEVARSQGWPLWPPYVTWGCQILFFLSGIPVALTFF